MEKPKLVLLGDKDSPAEGERIEYDIWHRRIRERKFTSWGEVIERTVLSLDEAKKVDLFFTTAINAAKRLRLK